MTAQLRVGFGLGLLAMAAGHGSMIVPPSRNAVDAELPAWSHGKNPPTGLIEPYSCHCNNGTEDCDSGQGCFWFSQGCNIGCPNCTGNGTRIPNLDQCPDTRTGPPGEMEGALLPRYRSINLNSTPGAIDDIWKFNPWRAPGKAPVFDSCGMAGGNWFEVFNAGAYKTTKFAKQGDLGTKVLKPRPSGTVWKRGSEVKPRWELTAAHGGGYQYRICPASAELNEACFSKTPLAFAKPYTHRVIMADPSKDYDIAATVVEEGGGLGWAVHPMGSGNDPHPCDWNPGATGQHCNISCPRCKAPWYAADGACPCSCGNENPGGISGNHFPALPQDVPYSSSVPTDPKNRVRSNTVEDTVVVPTDISPGEWVVQWRWDCEGTSQIWTSCSDITIE